ncbi:hypothetical protein M3Y95_01147700 [Aphelenchoides besseyi]|nr:hypothetical protein M3Y95_01147700 [Aphelenchoides besseyi]
MSDRRVAPPPAPSASKKKNSRRRGSKKPVDQFFPDSCSYTPGGCHHKTEESKAKCWRLKNCVSPNMIRQQMKRKAAKKAETQRGRWESDVPPAPAQAQAQAPALPSPPQPVAPPNQVDTNETVMRINIMIYTFFEGKVDEHGTPITREWYTKLVLDPNFSVKRTKMAGSSALKKKEMVPDKHQPVKQSSKERKKPNDN